MKEDGSAKLPQDNLINKSSIIWDYGAAVAQGTHNPLVVGSNPSGPSFLMFLYKIPAEYLIYIQIQVNLKVQFEYLIWLSID